MHKFAALLLTILVSSLALLWAVAQENGSAPPVDEELFAQGEEIYAANCAVCHGPSGAGQQEIFPALAGNQDLADISLIVENVHEGRGAMPAFPQFDAQQIAAVATYVRNAWDNEFGGVAVDEVAAQLGDDAADAAELRSIWDGVYTQEQAERGEPLYSSSCSMCHGYVWLWKSEPGDSLASPSNPGHLQSVSDPTLGPDISGPELLEGWANSTVGTLFQYTRSSMPLDNPGILSDQEYIDILAFLFAASDAPAGDEELPPETEVLDEILIEPEQQ